MPTYCFRTDDGEIVERPFRMGESPRRIRLDDGRVATRDIQAEHLPRRAGGGWPIVCYASGVHPDQAQDLRDHFRKHGLNVTVTDGGDPVYENAQQRKRALRCRGLHDRAGYD